MKEKMKREPNYKYIVAGNKVICFSTYAGKTVKGIAKCSPNDEFDEETGKALARLRCDFKVAQLRYKRAIHEFEYADWLYAYAEEQFNRAYDYVERADTGLTEAATELAAAIETLE